MKVKNLVSWSGDKFSYAPGDEITLDDDTAHARIALGLASYLSREDETRKPKIIKYAPKHPKVIAQEAAERARALRPGAAPAVGAPVASLANQVNELSGKLAAAEAEKAAERAQNEELKARLDALEKAIAAKAA